LGPRLTHVGDTDPTAAAAAARGADAAVVVVGLSSQDEGESMIGVDTASTQLLGGVARFRPFAAVMVRVAAQVAKLKKFGGDRRDLRLHSEDIALIEAVAAVNDRTVVVVIGGGTIVLDPWDSHVAAVLMAWYPGMEGGRAIADVLLGDAEPAGRLPMVIPHRQADLPTAAQGLRFPVLVKADIGGSGSGIVRYDTPGELATAAAERSAPAGVNGLSLIQEYAPRVGGKITRVETLAGKVLYALDVESPGDTFDLCPADACMVRPGAAALTITANNRTKTYGSTLAMGTTAYTYTGTLYNADAITGVVVP
jgi:hypothetical protein